jgi:hypothetical protein
VFSEHYVNFKNIRLFFDFYVPESLLLIECQGQQHNKFVKHFHGSAENFRAQKYRDNLKITFVQENNLYLIRLYDGKDITKEVILDKINKAFDSEYNFSD